MDLKDFAPSFDTVTVILYAGKGDARKPILNDDGSEMTITLYAPHTKDYKRAKNNLIRKAIEASTDKGEPLDVDFEEIFPLITKEWNITYEGKKPKFSVAKAKEVYTKVPLIIPQLDEALGKTEDFT